MQVIAPRCSPKCATREASGHSQPVAVAVLLQLASPTTSSVACMELTGLVAFLAASCGFIYTVVLVTRQSH